MAKSIPEDVVDSFRAHCHEFYNDALESMDGDTAAYWTLENYAPFQGEEWEFCPIDSNTYDIFELFERVSNEFVFEQDGYDSFFMSKK